MRINNNRPGFSIVEIAIVVAVVGLIGLVGYTAFNRLQDNKTNKTAGSTQSNQQSPIANDVEAAPSINSTSDLNEAEKTLDQTDPGGSNNTDAIQLDNELSAF